MALTLFSCSPSSDTNSGGTFDDATLMPDERDVLSYGLHLLSCSGSIVSLNADNNTIIIETSNFLYGTGISGDGQPQNITVSFSQESNFFCDWFFSTASLGDHVLIYYHQNPDTSKPIIPVNVIIRGSEEEILALYSVNTRS